MKSRRSDHSLAVLAFALALGPPLRAESEPRPPPGADRVESAREAFRLGSALAREGQWSDALAQFERSARLHPHATTTYNLGFCERALGHYTRARQLLARALAESARAPSPELSSETRREAEGYLAEVEKKLGHASVTVRGRGARISVDGRPLERLASARRRYVAGTREPGPAELVPAGTFELVADPGLRVVVVDGRTENVRFASGETSTLSFGEAPAGTQRGSGPDRSWAIAALGAGAAGLVVGTVSGLVALREKSSLDDHCSAGIDRCDPRYQGDIDAMNRAAGVSTVAFAVGALGVGAGVVLWVTAPDGRSPRGAVPVPRGVAFGGGF